MANTEKCNNDLDLYFCPTCFNYFPADSMNKEMEKDIQKQIKIKNWFPIWQCPECRKANKEIDFDKLLGEIKKLKGM